MISAASVRRAEGETVKFLDFALLGIWLVWMLDYPSILIVFVVLYFIGGIKHILSLRLRRLSIFEWIQTLACRLIMRI